MQQSGYNDVNIYLIGGDPGGGGRCTCLFERVKIWVFKCVKKRRIGKIRGVKTEEVKI